MASSGKKQEEQANVRTNVEQGEQSCSHLQHFHAASGLHNLIKLHKAPHDVLALFVLLLHQA